MDERNMQTQENMQFKSSTQNDAVSAAPVAKCNKVFRATAELNKYILESNSALVSKVRRSDQNAEILPHTHTHVSRNYYSFTYSAGYEGRDALNPSKKLSFA